jgi:hydroxyethylthiazole kinase-like uncharacterized protein yjeF
VQWPLPTNGWASEVLAGSGRFRSLVVGPGLGRGGDDDVRRLVAGSSVPVVVDGDGLTSLAPLTTLVPATTVLTPHDGELARLLGRPVGTDRLDDARRLAATAGCTVLLKGPITVVCGADGIAYLTATGDARLATAGTGDVLAGIIGGLLAQGLDPERAAAAGACRHAVQPRRSRQGAGGR